jgi:hypothetical protein
VPLREAGLLVAEDRFDVGLDDCDRVAELVGDIGQEPTFGGERAVETAEHAVDGVGQRAELVGWAGRLDPAGQVGGGDLLRGLGDRGHGPKGASGDPPADGQAESEHDHQRDDRIFS